MAYGNYLASVPPQQIESIRLDASFLLQPAAIIVVSHLTGHWVKAQPLGRLLGETLDGGSELSKELWHPLRVPKYHSKDRVPVLLEELSLAWRRAVAAGAPNLHWFKTEIELAMNLLEKASREGHCVVSVLEPPSDEERGSRVRIPFTVPPDAGQIQ